MILAVDFDGVIHDKANPIKGRRMGLPMSGVSDALNHFRRVGHDIIVFTVMATTDGGKKAVEDWMKYYELPYDEVTAIKPNADFYIDDKAIRFNNWSQVLSDMEVML